VPGIGQLEGQRHGEAAGMRRRDQLFGIGARTVFEAGVEAIGLIGQRARFARHMALARFAEAFVFRVSGFNDRHKNLLVQEIRRSAKRGVPRFSVPMRLR
jgi:hypothetical protein